MDISANSALVGGFLTVAGRVYLDPTNGCPRAVLVDTDRNHDRSFGDAAKELMAHPKGLQWAGHHLYKEYWNLETK